MLNSKNRTKEREENNMIDTEELLLLISEYIEKHELAKELGSEYIYQDDKAQQDAIKLVADIFENCF